VKTYRRFEHDLYWGHRLHLMRFLHRAHGFRGDAKGSGFRAYLQAEKIPSRKAYRLIKRYLRMEAIRDNVRVANAALEAAVFPLPSPELVADLRAELKAMRDSDRDTNADVRRPWHPANSGGIVDSSEVAR
jgi:hypothetical protein